MTPTPEQVAQWAHEADKHAAHKARGMVEFYKLRDAHLVTRAMAERAEDDAKVAETTRIQTYMTESYIRQVAEARESIAAAIRANAPKVTT
ncbi:MAG: hypothetical protein V4738_14390 [Pseudomonadota bacterium]